MYAQLRYAAAADFPCNSVHHVYLRALALPIASQSSGLVALQTAWLTPVELFKPWYGQAVAKYIVRHHSLRKQRQPLHIAEVGGGNGTLAANILVCAAKCFGAKHCATVSK